MAGTPTTVRGLPPEATLLARAAHDRERGAWEELVARYQGLVRAVVGSFRLQEADVADAVQSTWLRALERLDTVRDPQCLGGWLATVARRECLALLARARRESPMELDDLAQAAVESGPEAMAVAADTREAVGRAVAALPPRRRDLVYALFCGPDDSYAAVARTTGLAIGSIGPTRQRALGTLRGALVLASHDACSTAWRTPGAALRDRGVTPGGGSRPRRPW
jgi:RNA polymerase sigma factor (sigma-70 family)